MDRKIAKNILRTTSNKITLKQLSVCAVLVLFISIIPLLILAQYSFPLWDDFTNGLPVKQVVDANGTLLDIARAIWQYIRTTYVGWQGSFSSLAVFTLQPGVFGYQYYFLTTYILLGHLLAGTFYFCYIVVHIVLRAKTSAAVMVASVLSFVCIHQVPSTADSFYWYNGSMYYTYFYSVSLFLLGLVLAYIFDKNASTIKKIGYLFFATPLAFWVGGGNYITALVTTVLVSCIVAAAIFATKGQNKPLILPFFALVFGLLISALAPGNAARSTAQLETPGLFKSIYQSFVKAFFYSVSWCHWFVILGILILLPLFWKLSARTKWNYRAPLLVSAFSLVLIAIAFFPHIFATTDNIPVRIINIIFFQFVILLASNAFYWLGWLRKKADGLNYIELTTGVEQYVHNHLPTFLLAACLVSIFMLAGKDTVGFSNSGAYRQTTFNQAISTLESGDAQRYGAQYHAWMAVVEQADETSDLNLPQISTLPEIIAGRRHTLSYYDSEDWKNVVFAEYYGVQSVDAYIPETEDTQ